MGGGDACARDSQLNSAVRMVLFGYRFDPQKEGKDRERGRNSLT